MGTSSVAQGSPVPARRTSIGVEVRVDITVDTAMAEASPGWYYDPADEAVYRWFDGEAWTTHRSDLFSSDPPLANDSPRVN